MGVRLKVGTQSDARDCGAPCKCSVEAGFEQRGVDCTEMVLEGKEERAVVMNKIHYGCEEEI